MSRKSQGNLVFRNIIFGFGTKLITIALSFLIPRLFITSYGSEVNGLLSTISQIFTYLALLEAGIGTASVNALYKPLDRENREQVNEVLSQSRMYFRKVTRVYVVCVMGFACIYPFVAHSSMDKWTISAVILLQGATSCISYYFCATYEQLLRADGKQYILDSIGFLIHVGISVAKIVLVSLGYSIVIVQLGYLVVSVAKIPIIFALCKKQYPWLQLKRAKTCELLKERKAFVVHQISQTIFTNTDVLLISSFCSFALASVYSVYNMVFGALNAMVNTANAGLGFVLGQNYYKDREHFLEIYDCYGALYSMAVFIIMSVAYILMIPFVQLYTAGVTDVNYALRWLPLLFTMVNVLSGIRAVASRLITVSGHAEKTQNRSVLEAIINIVASLVLVQWLGIYGVLLGTIVALLYRTNDMIIYANKVILKRNPWKEYKGLLVDLILFVGIAVVASNITLPANNYLELVGVAIIVALVVAAIYICAMLLMNRKILKFLVATIRNKTQRTNAQ